MAGLKVYDFYNFRCFECVALPMQSDAMMRFLLDFCFCFIFLRFFGFEIRLLCFCFERVFFPFVRMHFVCLALPFKIE